MGQKAVGNMLPQGLRRWADVERLATITALAGLLCLGVYLLRFIAFHPFFADNVRHYDIWYCGARVIGLHRDPYLVEPLRACEHAIGAYQRAWIVEPGPLPGYAFALMWPVLALPLGIGKALWVVIALASLGVSAWCSSQLTKLPFIPVLAVFAPVVGMLNIRYGGLEPVAIAALCVAALALERGAPRTAAIFVTLAMIEPHVGLPAFLALAILVPGARPALAAGAVVLGALSVLLLGLGTNIEWLTTILPAQNAAESLFSVFQFGLTHVLYVLGVPARAATWLGSLSYILTIALGIVAAARIRTAYGRAAAIVLVPVATSLFGGVYVHDHQISAALPGALLLATLPFPPAGLAAGAVALLASLWSPDSPLLALSVAFAVGTSILLLAPKLRPGPRLALALLVPLAFAAYWRFDATLVHSRAAETAQPALIRPADPASVGWGYLLRWTPGDTVDDAATLLLKVPWWLGLGLAGAAAAGALRTQRT